MGQFRASQRPVWTQMWGAGHLFTNLVSLDVELHTVCLWIDCLSGAWILLNQLLDSDSDERFCIVLLIVIRSSFVDHLLWGNFTALGRHHRSSSLKCRTRLDVSEFGRARSDVSIFLYNHQVLIIRGCVKHSRLGSHGARLVAVKLLSWNLRMSTLWVINAITTAPSIAFKCLFMVISQFIFLIRKLAFRNTLSCHKSLRSVTSRWRQLESHTNCKVGVCGSLTCIFTASF